MALTLGRWLGLLAVMKTRLIDCAARDARYQELLSIRPIRIPGVDDVICELAKHFQLAIVTTSRDQDFDLIHELGGFPRTTVTPDVVRYMKFIL